MKTKTFTLIGISILALTPLLTAHAQTYQWKDAQGRTVISDVPPPKAVKPAQRLGSAPSEPEAAADKAPTEKAAPPAPKTLAERDLEFKKRQQESKDKADKAAKEQAAASERQENCKRAKEAQNALESNQRIASVNEKGERTFMDDTQRQAELERARRVANESCK